MTAFVKSQSCRIAVALLATAAFTASACQPSNGEASSAQPTAGSYGKLPLSFEANRGQTDPSVRFLARGSGYALYLTGSGAVLALARFPVPAHSGAATQDILRMTLAGATQASHVDIAGEDSLPGKVNYFLGNDPSKWYANLPTYAKVRYREVYPGVDLVFYGNRRQLEYDFVVAPGVSAEQIRLRFTGNGQPRIDSHGDLLLEGVNGEAVLHKPVVYQEKDGQRQPIPGSFQQIDSHTIGFKLGSYDHARPLVIDPVLVYSTYLGGSGASGNGDQGNGIAVDSSGSAYVVGTAYSTNFSVTGGAFQSTNNAQTAGHGSTVFVSKLNPSGTALVYSTYLGGSGSTSGGDFGYGIALDSANNAYITGATYSKDFPITCGAFQHWNHSATTGATTGFVTKLNPAGNGLAYSTYLGGEGNETKSSPHGDVAQAIAVNAAGNAYVTGYTWSVNFPVTQSAFQSNYHGSATISNAFVAELNRTATSLVYATYLGGSGSNGQGDYANSIAIDSSGDAFVAGATSSPDFPVSSGALQASLTGSSNAFAVELNPTGADEIYATYLGGTGADSATAIALDANGFAYVAGNTSSSNFPLTVDSLEGTGLGFVHDMVNYGNLSFLTKLSQNGSELEYSTYVEGSGTSITGLAVDSAGDAFVTGSTSTAGVGEFAGFQTTPNALPTAAANGNSAFLVKLDPSAATLSYATVLGGSSTDQGLALALDASGSVYLTGAAYSSDFPTTSGAYQTANQAAAAKASNAFVSKFALVRENNKTAYPTLPAGGVPTSLIINFEYMVPGDDWAQYIGLTLDSAAPGPPPTGTVEVYGSGFPGYANVPGTWNGVSGEMDIWSYMDDGASPTWQATYSGDSVYQTSSISGTAVFPNCSNNMCCPPECNGLVRSAPAGSAKPLNSASVPAVAVRATPVRKDVSMPKFAPPPSDQREDEAAPLDEPSPQSQETSGCVASSEPPLTVIIHAASRLYGTANPTFVVTLSTQLSGQSVTVTPQTTATPSSPVGTYPITSTITGADAANYTITVVDGTLSVTKAPLYISARNVSSVYGQTPPQPTQYFLTGFVNGDKASVVSGAPILTTTVTSGTPVGFYKIGVQVGTLSAANYYFDTSSAGEGAVEVDKAPLYISASNVPSIYGQTPPQPTQYFLTGFVNGDTASVVTGAPVLTTTVTSTTPVGFYKIGVQVGTLLAANYHFVTTSSGEGSVDVSRKPLLAIANNQTMTQGGPVPPLTYTLTGFVNGDTAAGSVTGAPDMFTTATSSSPPGQYLISGTIGTLASHNYSFTRVNGTMTVLP